MHAKLNDVQNEFMERNQPSPVFLEPFNNALERKFGVSPTDLPLYKLVWGQEEMAWAMGGMKLKYPLAIINDTHIVGYNIKNVVTNNIRYSDGAKFPELVKGKELAFPRYVDDVTIIGRPRFILERWVEQDSQETWERNRWEGTMDVLGPYPSKGQYFEIMTLETPLGEFQPLTWTVFDECVMRRIERAHQADEMTQAEWYEQNSQGKVRLDAYVKDQMQETWEKMQHRAKRFVDGNLTDVKFESTQEYK